MRDAVGAAGVLFLQVGAVQQQHLGQVPRGGRGDHAAVEARLHQHRQPAAVVQVGVAEHHRVGPPHRLGGWLPVAFTEDLETLVKPAVQQDPLATQFRQVARTRHRVRRAQKTQLHRLGSLG